MLLNIILGFVIPWIIALVIIRERKIIYYIAPFASAISFIVDDLGFYYFWNLYPFKLGNISAIPFNIGLFCLYPCIVIELIRKYKFKVFFMLFVSSLIITLMEGCGLLVDRVFYRNNWNIVATYFSYFISLVSSYTFYKILERQRLV